MTKPIIHQNNKMSILLPFLPLPALYCKGGGAPMDDIGGTYQSSCLVLARSFHSSTLCLILECQLLTFGFSLLRVVVSWSHVAFLYDEGLLLEIQQTIYFYLFICYPTNKSATSSPTQAARRKRRCGHTSVTKRTRGEHY